MTSSTFSPLQNASKLMPVLFIGHGSPMNAITKGTFSENLSTLGEKIAKEYGKPKALLVISAHWITHKFCLRAQNGTIPMIYDMYGFPKELYEVRYDAQGEQNLAMEIKEKLGEKAYIDNSWGLDHGAWSVLLHLYPKAEIPIIMVSTPVGLDINEVFAIGKELFFLRTQGVCIVASGNVVHNLGDFSNTPKEYALRFDAFIKEAILHDCVDSNAESSRENVADSKALSSAMQAILQSPKMTDFKCAVPSLEHFYPLILALGAWQGNENPIHTRKAEFFNEEITLGSVSMTSYFLH